MLWTASFHEVIMKRKTKWILVSLVGALLLVFFLSRFREVALLLLFSVIASYLLYPMVDAFTAKNVPSAVAILICYGIFLIILLFLITSIVPFLYNEFRGIISSLPVYYQYVLSLWDHYMADGGLGDFFQTMGFDENLMDYLGTMADRFGDQTFQVLSLIPKLLLGSLLIPVISYYFLKDKNKILGNVLMVFPPRTRVSVITLWEHIDEVLRSFIGGNLLVSLIVGILTFVGLWILGVEYAVVLGLLYGLFDIIPYFGPFLGAIPIVIFPLLQGEVNIFLVILVLFFVQQCENYFISPRILGKQVGLHPVSVIILVLIGGYSGGVFGMVFIIPVAAVAKVLISFFYEKLVASTID